MSKERRKHIRIQTSHVVLNINGRQLAVRDITRGGAFVTSQTPPKPEEIVNVEVTLPGDLGKLGFAGQVVRVNWSGRNGPKGFAIKFFGLNDGEYQILDAFLEFIRNREIIRVKERLLTELYGRRPAR